MSRTIAVIGTGIAGPVFALHILTHPALRRAFRPVLYDGSSEVSAGTTVLLFANGMYPLHAFGLGAPLSAAGTEFRDLDIWRSVGDGLEAVGTTQILPCELGPALYFERPDLQRVIIDAVVNAGGEVHWGKKAVSFEKGWERTTVRFGDGTSTEADIIIGADGAYSATRKHLLETKGTGSNWAPYFTPFTALYGMSAIPNNSPRSDTVWYEPGFMSSGPSGSGTRWDLMLPELPRRLEEDLVSERLKKHPSETSNDGWRSTIVPGRYHPATTAAILEACADLPHPQAGNFGALVESATRIVHTPLVQRVWTVDEIADERTVLIGDAARVMLPTSGQGTGFAIEDATVLAGQLLKTLDKTDGVEVAFRAYGGQRITRGRMMAAAAMLGARYNVGATPLSRKLRNAVGKYLSSASLTQTVWPMDLRVDLSEMAR